jgi:hypothetical protein
MKYIFFFSKLKLCETSYGRDVQSIVSQPEDHVPPLGLGCQLVDSCCLEKILSLVIKTLNCQAVIFGIYHGVPSLRPWESVRAAATSFSSEKLGFLYICSINDSCSYKEKNWLAK